MLQTPSSTLLTTQHWWPHQQKWWYIVQRGKGLTCHMLQKSKKQRILWLSSEEAALSNINNCVVNRTKFLGGAQLWIHCPLNPNATVPPTLIWTKRQWKKHNVNILNIIILYMHLSDNYLYDSCRKCKDTADCGIRTSIFSHSDFFLISRRLSIQFEYLKAVHRLVCLVLQSRVTALSTSCVVLFLPIPFWAPHMYWAMRLFI